MSEYKATAEQVIAEARRWIGTPFLHQGRVLGRGVDCIGLAVAIDKAFGLVGYPDPLDYPPDPVGSMMARRMAQYLLAVPRNEARPGDILHFAWGKFPQHVAILTNDCTIVHADRGAGKVVEVGYTGPWPRRKPRVYRFPGVKE